MAYSLRHGHQYGETRPELNMTDSQRELEELQKRLKVGEGEIGQRVHRTTLKQFLNDARLGVVLEEGLKIVAVTF